MGFAYPVNLDVTGRRCVVVGGGAIAASKALALVEAEAVVVVVTERPRRQLEELAQRGALRLTRRPFQPEDLDGAFLAIATGEDPVDNRLVRVAADARGVLLNAIDDVANCDFAFPAIVRHGDLRVAISTAGKAPALARQLRIRLERELGPEWGVLLDLLGEAREAALPRTVSFSEWQRRWRQLLADVDVLIALVAAGRLDEVRAELRRHLAPEQVDA